jgi:hypothetical protein
MYKLVLLDSNSNIVITVSKKYYSSYMKAQEAANLRYKETGMIWTIKPVKLG